MCDAERAAPFSPLWCANYGRGRGFVSVLLRWLAIGLLAVTGGLLLPTVTAFASAGDPACPHGGNATASACFYGTAQFGSYAEFHSNNLLVNSALEQQGYHLNQSVWSYSGSPCSAWIETGVTQGYHGEVAYTWYWAFNDVNNNYADFKAGYTSPNGINHSYRLVYNGGSQYLAKRDGTQIGAVPGLGAGSCISQAGFEASGGVGLNYYHADTFDLNPLLWQDTAYNYHTRWNTNQYWNDFPCGQYGSGFCFNGVFYSSSRWSDNKP